MPIQLNELERKLQNLIEVHLVKLLPAPSLPDRLAQRLTEAVRASVSTHELSTSNISNQFILKVHPSALPLWQKDQRLLDGLTKILRLAAIDAGVQFSGAPSIGLDTDPTLAVDDVVASIIKEEIPEETANMETALSEDPPAGRTAFLIVGGTKVYTITQSVTNIGRRLDNHLVVDDPRVSRYHSQIRFANGRFIIFDLNSTGGTYVNGQRMNQSVLYPGDVISLAGLPIVFGQDTPPQSLRSGSTGPLSPNSANRQTAILKNPIDEKNFKKNDL